MQWLHSVWCWLGPGGEALALVAPVGNFLAVAAASFVALRSLRLRMRIDDADQWWKRAQYGIDLLHKSNKEKAAGAKILYSLIGNDLPDDASQEIRQEHENSEKLRKKYGWKVSLIDQEMLSTIVAQSLGGDDPDGFTDAERKELAGQLLRASASLGTFARQMFITQWPLKHQPEQEQDSGLSEN